MMDATSARRSRGAVIAPAPGILHFSGQQYYSCQSGLIESMILPMRLPCSMWRWASAA
jgi:hypothetical protein